MIKYFDSLLRYQTFFAHIKKRWRALTLPPFICLIVAFFMLLQANSQNIIQGIVLNSDGEIIPFATLYVKEAGRVTNGWVGDKNGFFAIEKKNTSGSDSLFINSLGFSKKAVSINLLRLDTLNEIILSTKPFEINVVEVKPNTKVKSTTLGTYKLRANWGYWCPGPYGYTLAIYIENKDKLKNGFLKSVKIKFKDLPKKGISDRVRIHVYAVAKDSLHPGEELLPTSVYPIESDVKGKWLKVDLSNYNIRFPENSFFVGAELLPTTNYFNEPSYKSIDKIDLSKGIPNWIIEMEANQICLFRGKNDNDASNTWLKKDVQSYWERERKTLHVDREWASEAVMGAKIIYYKK